MGRDPDGDERSPRYPKRERVTLKWASPPLKLPGEERRDEAPDESAELELPPASGSRPSVAAPAAGPATDPATGPATDPEASDAWDRERPAGVARRQPTPSAFPAAGDAEGGALSLVDRRARPSSPSIDLATEMEERYALGDYTAALRTAELILGRQPEHPRAQEVSSASRQRLAQLYRSRLGALSRRPRVAVDEAEVRWLGLDHRAGFLLSRVDGVQSLEALIDVSGMPRLEALKTLVELLDVGAIRIEG
ncbi:MAG TPA: hypothetical protein RMH99_31420 [Sandaracinaceae bacterium LLY-WYZ-13_1]|nr:hypothetical protein [Sandaracinaceae bacterium LLY-WYZ-13_1]